MKGKYSLVLNLYKQSICVQAKAIVCKGLLLGVKVSKCYLYHITGAPEAFVVVKGSGISSRSLMERKFKCL
jgi:hypothetical protein